MVIQRQCQICTKIFFIKPSHARIGWGKYCSQTCRHSGQLRGQFFNCHWCNKAVWRSPNQIQKSSSGFFFCNKHCSMAWKNSDLRSGSNHPLWQGGESSYRQRMKLKDLAPVCTVCGIEDVRVLAVHHINRNRKNNDFSNLMWLCHNCHYLEHHPDMPNFNKQVPK